MPVAAGRYAGASAAHVDKAHRVCLTYNSGAVGDEQALLTVLASLWSYCAGLLTGSTDDMNSFLAKPGHIEALHSRLSRCREPCWLADA